MKSLYQSLWFPLSALTLLTGCSSVGPDYSPPSLSSARLPASFGEASPGINYAAVEVEWWRAFDDPILSGLIRQALSVNHDIGIAAMRLEEAKALLREDRQSFLPSGGPAFSYENRRKSEIETSPDQARQQETYRGAVDTAWEIDLFGRVRRSVEEAQAQAGSREALLRDVQAGVSSGGRHLV